MITEQTIWAAECDITGVRINSAELAVRIKTPIKSIDQFKTEIQKLGWRITMGTKGERVLCPEFVKSVKEG